MAEINQEAGREAKTGPEGKAEKGKTKRSKGKKRRVYMDGPLEAIVC